MAPLLFVVARNEASRYEFLARAFAGEPAVDVVLDRRASKRRAQDTPPSTERQARERRSEAAEQTLQRQGWRLVRKVP